jgi:hypothetical protein
MGFSMQDILLEPYGGQILHLSVSATTVLTALMAAGSLAGFAIAARSLSNSGDPCRLAAVGALAGLPGFSAIILAAPMGSDLVFRIGATTIGFGAGLFAVGTLAAAMSLSRDGQSGLALGAWGLCRRPQRAWVSRLAEASGTGSRCSLKTEALELSSPTPRLVSVLSTTSKSRCFLQRSSQSVRSCAQLGQNGPRPRSASDWPSCQADA